MLAAASGASAAGGGEQHPGSSGAPAAKPPARWRSWVPSPESAALLAACWRLLRANLAAVVIIHAAKEALVFMLHRVTQRATNAGAHS